MHPHLSSHSFLAALVTKNLKKDKQSKSIQYVFHLLALLCWCTYAGHGSWEPPRQSQAAAAGSSTFESALHKRYLIIQPHGTLRTWPNGGEIKYRFENEATKKKLLYNLEAARDRWYAASLPEAKFKLTEASAVEFRIKRYSVLLITYNDQGQLSTTPGLPAKDDSDPTYKGPTMTLSDRTDVSMLGVIANYAHELGHAWGLLHEHQTPQFWALPYSTMSVSGRFRFNCPALKDYAEAAARLSVEELDEACKERSKAAAHKFYGPTQYLPIFQAYAEGQATFGGSPDLRSIMLYPSGAGGTGSATQGNDQRADVLLLSDGSKITPNLRPSTRDVEGLLKLYNTDWGTTNPRLLSEAQNPKNNVFKRLFKKQNCS